MVLLVLSFGQRRRISDLEQDAWNAQNSIMDEVSRLSGQTASLRWNQYVYRPRRRRNAEIGGGELRWYAALWRWQGICGQFHKAV